MENNIFILNNKFKIRIDLIVLFGSRLYGINNAESDYDYRGVFTILNRDTLEELPKRIEDKTILKEIDKRLNLNLHDLNDIVLYETKTFLSLAMNNNPNIIDILFSNEQLYVSAQGKILIDNKNKFLSKKLKYTFSGYGFSNLKKMKTHNNILINFPYILDIINILKDLFTDNKINFNFIQTYFPNSVLTYFKQEFKVDNNKSISISEFYNIVKHKLDIDITKYIKSDIINFITMFNTNGNKINIDADFKLFIKHKASFKKITDDIVMLFNNNKIDIGVFDANDNIKDIKLDISKDSDFIGILKVNKIEYKGSINTINNIYKWILNRNKKRLKNEKVFKYDVKNASHLMRLLEGCKLIFTTNEYNPTLQGDLLEFIKNIRQGKFTYDFITNRANNIIKEIDILYKQSSLPNKVNFNIIENLYEQIIK